MIDLNDMIDANNAWVSVDVGGTLFSAASQGWVIRTAEKVNDGNWIVGYGTKTGSGVRAFVLAPR